jgi:hypothetical protein
MTSVGSEDERSSATKTIAAAMKNALALVIRTNEAGFMIQEFCFGDLPVFFRLCDNEVLFTIAQ